MQEVLQYEASYGSLFWVVILVAGTIYLYTNFSFARNGNSGKINSGEEIFSIYCGEGIGRVYRVFSSFFCYISFIVMVGGANSILSQQWNLPNGFGAVILSILAVVTVLTGFSGILKALSLFGPIIIGLLLFTAVASCFSSFGNLESGFSAIDQRNLQITQIGNNNPIASGASYGGFVILWFASFMAELGANNDFTQVKRGVLLSFFFIFGTSIVCCMALIGNIGSLYDADIPALILASSISPVFGSIFSLIIFTGIYTSAVPLLWTGVKSIPLANTYSLFTVIAGIAGCLVACFIPYAPLLNIVYGLNGYLGFALIVFMIIFDIRRHLNCRKKPDTKPGLPHR